MKKTETDLETTTEQAPVVDTTESTEQDNAVYLPSDYLSGGYYAVKNGVKYLRPEFVGIYAEFMASLLAGMKPADFNSLLREMKRSKKKTLPFEARQTAAAEMIPKSLALIYHKKAPSQLVTFIKDNLEHIHDDDDWMAFYRHLDAISSFLLLSTEPEEGDSE